MSEIAEKAQAEIEKIRKRLEELEETLQEEEINPEDDPEASFLQGKQAAFTRVLAWAEDLKEG